MSELMSQLPGLITGALSTAIVWLWRHRRAIRAGAILASQVLDNAETAVQTAKPVPVPEPGLIPRAQTENKGE